MKKIIIKYRPFLYLAFVLPFIFAPLEAFEGTSFCLYSNFLGFLCAGCGVTRGFCAFMQLDFEKAVQYNSVFAYSVFPIALFLMLEDSAVLALRALKKCKRKSLVENAVFVFDEFMAKK